jgi:two-component system, NarL family, nitrate/nitrite response regulator NarL
MRVLLCDHHRLLVESMAAVFQGRGHAVEEALNPRQAAALLVDRPTDVCVVDLGFPDYDGDPVADMRAASPMTGIVVFTATCERGALDRARESGAHGYVSKEDSLASLVDLVEGVGGDPGAGAASWVARPPASWVTDHSPHFLTPRERQALEGLVQGKNTSELARWMGVRQSTVSTHIQTVLTKLGVHSRLEAVAYAMANRLVTVDR